MNTESNIVETLSQKITVKEAGRKFGCFHGTLKNAIKDKRLPAEQDGRGTYWLDADEVEKFLRSTPTIASSFHPKEENSANGGQAVQTERDDFLEPPGKRDQVPSQGSTHQESRSADNPPASAVPHPTEQRRNNDSRAVFHGQRPVTSSTGRNGIPPAQVGHGYPSYQSAVKLLDSMSQKHWLKLQQVIEQRINAWVSTI